MNKPLYAKNGYRYDRKVTAMMIEDMIFDPVLAMKVLLDITTMPHQELRVLTMWTTGFTLDDSGFSTGKSFTFAAISAIRSMLFPNRISGVLSGNFRQGKLIFNYYDKWSHTSSIFKNSLEVSNGKPSLIHGSDVHLANFRGGSRIRVLPPNTAQNADTLRSERWHDGYVDEWVIFPDYTIITKTVTGRCTEVNDYDTCPVRQNHLHLGSTPQYQHSPSYSLVQSWDAEIEAGNKNYAHITFNYRHVPRTLKYKGKINYRVIHTMQKTNPIGVVRSEVDGLWQSDSQSFYPSNEVDAARAQSSTYQPSRMNASDIYIAAFDTARGNSRTRKGNRDDFAITVLRIPNGDGKPRHCLTVRRSGITAERASGLIHELHRKFQFSWIMYDPGGGGLFVADELEKEEQYIRNVKQAVRPITHYGDEIGSAVIGDAILVAFRRGSEYVEGTWGSMSSDSVLVNRMHQVFSEAIRENAIDLAQEFNWSATRMRANDVNGIRNLLNKAAGMSEAKRAQAEMDLAVKQLILIDVERGADGMPKTDKFGMYKFKSKNKKDSAYSLAYAFVMYFLWLRVIKKKKKKPQVGFAASAEEM